MAKSTIEDIVRGINQAAAAGVDGALDKDGKPKSVGLKRDEGHPILDSRVIDGFACTISVDKLCITYQVDCKLKDVHEKGFEADIESMIEKVVKFLKKEYKSLTGNALSLSPVKKSFQVNVNYISKVRTTVQAKKVYTIGGMGEMDELYGVEHEVDKKYQKFLDQGGWGGPKPDNVKGGIERNKKDKEITTIIGESKVTSLINRAKKIRSFDDYNTYQPTISSEKAIKMLTGAHVGKIKMMRHYKHGTIYTIPLRWASSENSGGLTIYTGKGSMKNV